MKTLRKNYLLLVLSVVLTLCLSLAFLFTSQTAKADEVNADLFTMEQGAQAALTKDGLRFRVKMGENVYAKIVTDDTANEKTLSVLVAPKTLFDKVTDGNYVNLEKKVEIVFEDESKIYLQDGYYWANAVLTNLDAENNMAITDSQYDLSFSAIGVINTVGGQPEYATFHDGDVANNTRTQYDVLKAAVLAVEDEEGVYDNAGAILDQENSPYKNWFGTEQYPIDVDNADGYGALQAKVAAGLITTAQFNVYNKFDIVDRENLPENTDFYHYVKFFDDSTELETVEVKEGNEAVCSKTVPAYKALEAMAGYARGYRNCGWVADDESVLDLSAINANVNAYINWVHGQLQNYLLEDLRANEPDTVLSFDTELGTSQLKYDGDSPWESRSFDTTKKLAGQKGTTKINWTGAYGNLYFGYFTNVENPVEGTYNEAFDYSRYDADNSYVVMDMYAEFPEAIDRIYVRVAYSGGHGIIANNSWGKIVVPLSKWAEAAQWFNVNPVNGDGSLVESSGAIYLAKAYVVTGDEIETIASEDSFNIGSMAMAGAEFFNRAISRDDIFTNAYYSTIQLIEGQLFYTSSNLNEDRGAFLVFAQAQTGTLYFTARGLDETADAQRFDEAGGHVDTPNFVYVGDAGDGYSVYSLDLADYMVKKIKLRTYKRNNQVWISDISTTNPLA